MGDLRLERSGKLSEIPGMMNRVGSGKRAIAGIAFVAVILLASGCVTNRGGSVGVAGGSDEAARLATRYLAAEPLKDARKSFEKGDFRIYVVVKGMRGFYPGIDYQIGSYYEQRYGAIELPGGADYYDGDDHPDFVAAADNYASVYNRAMINRLAAFEQTGAGAAR